MSAEIVNYTTYTQEAALDRIEGMLAEGWVLVEFRRVGSGAGPCPATRTDMKFVAREAL